MRRYESSSRVPLSRRSDRAYDSDDFSSTRDNRRDPRDLAKMSDKQIVDEVLMAAILGLLIAIYLQNEETNADGNR